MSDNSPTVKPPTSALGVPCPECRSLVGHACSWAGPRHSREFHARRRRVFAAVVEYFAAASPEPGNSPLRETLTAYIEQIAKARDKWARWHIDDVADAASGEVKGFGHARGVRDCYDRVIVELRAMLDTVTTVATPTPDHTSDSAEVAPTATGQSTRVGDAAARAFGALNTIAEAFDNRGSLTIPERKWARECVDIARADIRTLRGEVERLESKVTGLECDVEEWKDAVQVAYMNDRESLKERDAALAKVAEVEARIMREGS